MAGQSTRYWPASRAEFDALAARAKARYAPVMARLPLHELVGMRDALSDAVEALRAEAHAEDLERGFRPPGTSIGR